MTAADLVNGEGAEALAKIFWEFGDERDSRRFARAIVHDRALRKFETTRQLADLIERLAPRHGKKAHPATKVFQALRIAVNDEIGSLKRGLEGAVKILKPGGRLAVITFHSLEDRVVKEFGREKTRDYTFSGEVDVPELRTPRVPELKWVSRKAILPGEEELKEIRAAAARNCGCWKKFNCKQRSMTAKRMAKIEKSGGGDPVRPALKASFVVPRSSAGSAVGYVWQKNEIYRLGQQIRQRETKLAQLQNDNKRLGDQISILHSPVMIDRRAKELNLGLAPATPLQVVRLTETPVAPEK